jgi:hypothetical protein
MTVAPPHRSVAQMHRYLVAPPHRSPRGSAFLFFLSTILSTTPYLLPLKSSREEAGATGRADRLRARLEWDLNWRRRQAEVDALAHIRAAGRRMMLSSANRWPGWHGRLASSSRDTDEARGQLWGHLTVNYLRIDFIINRLLSLFDCEQNNASSHTIRKRSFGS